MANINVSYKFSNIESSFIYIILSNTMFYGKELVFSPLFLALHFIFYLQFPNFTSGWVYDKYHILLRILLHSRVEEDMQVLYQSASFAAERIQLVR